MAGADHQGRRQLPAQPARHGRESGAQQYWRQAGSLQPLGTRIGRAAELLAQGDRHHGEERAAGVGSIEVRRRFQIGVG